MSDIQVATCPAHLDGIDGTPAVLACWLLQGHPGPHYDEAEDLRWQKGKAEQITEEKR